MQQGGWSFDSELQNREKVDWSNGNTFDTLIYAFGLYLIFIIISKMKLIPNLLVLGLLLLIYILNSQREFLHKRNVITNKDNEYYRKYIYSIAIFIGIVCIVGVYDYYKYQKIQYGKEFNILLFWFSVKSCDYLK